ncbi:hypothetical protein AXW84_00225 (plasmid) [Hymenobacter sp. PAMC 26628]|nr:hypothetical protein AXW84_00225 [Hymenobacter sp. PAMC 26628]
MDADLKALHSAVNAFSKARREARSTAKALSRAGRHQWGMGWDRRHYLDQLEQCADRASSELAQAESDCGRR